MSQRGQRARLLGRARPSLSYRLLVDAEGAERAQLALSRARSADRQVRLAERGEDASEAAARGVTEAEAELSACYEAIRLRALPLAGAVTVEALIKAHPPTPAQLAAARAEREEAQQRGEAPPDWPMWDDDTFRPALLAASAADAGMSADDWTTFLAEHVSVGEALGLWHACLSINQQQRIADPVVLPKGSMGILN